MKIEEFMLLLQDMKQLRIGDRQAGKYHTAVPHMDLKEDRVTRIVFYGNDIEGGISKTFDERDYRHGRKMFNVIVEYMSRDWHWYLD